MKEPFTLFSFVILLFLCSMFPIPAIFAFNSTHLPLCHDDERLALFQFKESFIIDEDASSDDPFAYPKVESWKLNGDCCSWDGVECDHLTGHVVGLDLSSSCLYGSINSNSSLFRLVHLRKLNLTLNHFNYSQIPPAIGLLSKLVSLDMSSSFLSGTIPSHVSSLSSLSYLDLSLNDQLSFQPSDFRHFINNLAHSLEVLMLSTVNISSTVPAILANASSLSTLYLKNCGLYGEFPVEIFHLPKLEALSLRFNENLRGYLPEFHSTSPLRSLKLESTSFSGAIPGSIGNLDSLIELDLSDCTFSGEIPGSIGNLDSLIELDLSDCTFSGEIPESLGNLTKLTYLYLSNNVFDHQHNSSLSWVARLTSLVELDLHNANLYGEFPIEIFHLPRLELLSLRYNENLRGYLPEFHSTSQLRRLKLESTSFSGAIPRSIGNLDSLTELDLDDCNFSGEIPESLGNLTKLIYLHLSDNSFNRQHTSSLSWVARLTNLLQLGLGKANLYGEFPSWFANLTQLSTFSLRTNHLTGSVPKSISQLRNIELLNLEGNRFTGTLEFDIFLKLEKLEQIFLSFNNLTLLINTNSNNTSPKFSRIGFGGCKLDAFPDFLRFQDKLEYLDLSKNSIAGHIPKWLWNMSTDTLQVIDFSSNFLTGFEAKPNPVVLPWVEATYIDLGDNMLQSSPPLPSVSIEFYYVSDNKLAGEIPPSFCNLTSLRVLEMANIWQLSGILPSCLGNFTDMEDLNLAGNDFYGTIPLTFQNGSNWRMIKLSYNQLQGEVPLSLSNCAKLEFLDIGNNQIRDVFPSWLGLLSNLKVLILRSNQFHGVLTGSATILEFQNLRIIDLSKNNFTGQLPTQYFFNWAAMKALDEAQWAYMEVSEGNDEESSYSVDIRYSIFITSKGTDRGYLQISENFVLVDFSCNRFEGDIPGVIGSLQGLRQLNLSHNNLSGDIPSTLANLTRLESLDLSQNKLSGAIPQQLAQLDSLAVFSVSHNFLTGPIPQGKQFNTFQNDSYQDNLGLCGNPLSRKCESSEAPPKLPPSLDDKDDSSSLLGFGWEPVVIGYASGLVFGLIIGYIVVTRHFEWFARFFRVRVKRTRRGRNRRVRN